jgi:FkbM family methyltransferase
MKITSFTAPSRPRIRSTSIITRTRRLLRRFGLDIVRRQAHLVDLLERCAIETVLDVGANEGQFASMLRRWGYKGKIISFEPIHSIFLQLTQQAQTDTLWHTRNEALGSSDCTLPINISELGVFSSIRNPTWLAAGLDIRSRTIGSELVRVRRLDSIWNEIEVCGNVFLKVDTQGFEAEVIRGAEGCLSEVAAIQLELSLRPLYEGETLLGPMLEIMHDMGFDPTFIQPVWVDHRNLTTPQVDCVFSNRARFTDLGRSH